MKQTFLPVYDFKAFMGFVAPSVLTMIFVALYTIIDGIFIAVFVGSAALAGLNIVFPLLTVIYGIAIMFATGGAAIISIHLGAGEIASARKKFVLCLVVCVAIGVVLSILTLQFFTPLLHLLGATAETIDYCREYGLVLLVFLPVILARVLFEYFIRADGRPGFSFFVSVVGGATNIILDYLFICVLGWGIAGAAWGTVLGFVVSLLICIYYFTYRSCFLKWVRPQWDGDFLARAAVNGSSEMVTELSSGITIFLFNIVSLRYGGVDGIAAITIVLYVHFLLVSIYLGFISGAAPLISYFYGAKNDQSSRKIVRYSEWFILVSSVLVFVVALLAGDWIVRVFVDPASPVYEMAAAGLKLFSPCFLFVGINIFASGLFTAFSNGKISAVISLSRALVFLALGIVLLPLFFGFNGVWFAVPFAEAVTLILTFVFYRHYKKVYPY